MTVIDDRTPPASPRQASSAAVSRVFINQRRNLLGVAARILGCPCQAEDVVHDAFLKLCQDPCTDVLRCEASYVSRVVRNLALDSYRRQQFEKRLFTAEAGEQDAPLDTNSPDRIAIAQEQTNCLRDAMRRLPSRTRDAVMQYYFEEQSQKRIAERLGISAAMVNFILQDARSALGAMTLVR
ncbi:RNA polymerase sigma-70 factor, ECF subfamily [Cupriavidus sp. YR651]|uniref:sigma-70 family RNA polymerase sigma factor n=1 Tax=Cupriavidus sp. YR651 TaxID=1855315 RepID=UPI0008860C76|nr:sigma-70 family RNA polymerase sigma factor [Cupriavidus sp. YR651]SDC81764.1 RNA polymerase sigma-70 factor, ECF subfamily [Cupriavidus sp. YR651]